MPNLIVQILSKKKSHSADDVGVSFLLIINPKIVLFLEFGVITLPV